MREIFSWITEVIDVCVMLVVAWGFKPRCAWKITGSFWARLTTGRRKKLRRNWKLPCSTQWVSAKPWCQSSSIHILGGLARVSNIATPELYHSLDMLCSSMIRCQCYPDIWDLSPVLATRHAALLMCHRSEQQRAPMAGNRLTAILGAKKSCWCVGPGKPFAFREGRDVNERWVRSRGMKKGGWRKRGVSKHQTARCSEAFAMGWGSPQTHPDPLARSGCLRRRGL